MRTLWAALAAAGLGLAPLAAFSASGSGLILEAASYPNPFDARVGRTTLRWRLVEDSSVELAVYTVYGARVWSRSFTRGAAGARAGLNETAWDGTDESGRKVAKGMYLAALRAGGDLKILKVGVRH